MILSPVARDLAPGHHSKPHMHTVPATTLETQRTDTLLRQSITGLQSSGGIHIPQASVGQI